MKMYYRLWLCRCNIFKLVALFAGPLLNICIQGYKRKVGAVRLALFILFPLLWGSCGPALCFVFTDTWIYFTDSPTGIKIP